MGNLVDTFVIVPKNNYWREIIFNLEDEENKNKVLKAVGKKWRPILKLLIEHFDELNEIVEQNSKNADKIESILEDNGFCWGDYHNRFRGKCLRQVLRKAFYKTLLIVQNDYDPYKENKFIILVSDEVISEKEWENSMPEDQKSLHKNAPLLLKMGKFKQVRTIDGVVYTKFGKRNETSQED